MRPRVLPHHTHTHTHTHTHARSRTHTHSHATSRPHTHTHTHMRPRGPRECVYAFPPSAAAAAAAVMLKTALPASSEGRHARHHLHLPQHGCLPGSCRCCLVPRPSVQPQPLREKGGREAVAYRASEREGEGSYCPATAPSLLCSLLLSPPPPAMATLGADGGMECVAPLPSHGGVSSHALLRAHLHLTLAFPSHTLIFTSPPHLQLYGGMSG
jgi:hypothetical protein